MKTKIFLILFLFLIFPRIGEAGWYFGGTYAIPNGDCPTDGQDAESTLPADMPPYPGAPPSIGSQNRVIGGTPGVNITCNFWDGTNPSVSATNASATWKNANIPLTGNASDYGGSSLSFARFRLDNSNCWAGTPYNNGDSTTITTEGDHVLYLCGQDGVGNQGTWNGQYRLDKTSPITSANNTSAAWRNADISITLSASDALSGINGANTKYRWDNLDCVGGGTSYTNGTIITLSTEGQHTLYLCATDNAGNTATWNSSDYKLDKTNPTLSATNASPVWKKVDISINLSASDGGGSNLDPTTVRYRWDNSNCTGGGGNVFVNGQNITLSTEGDHTLYLCAADYAGNTQTWSGIYRLDKTNPVVSANNTSAAWKNADINITLSASDAGGSALNAPTVKYRWDNLDCVGGGTVFVNGTVITLSTEGQHTLYLCAADNAGNTATWNSNLYKLDKTNPVVSANNNSAVWKNLDISITLSASDGGGSMLSNARYVWRLNNIGAPPTDAACLASGTPYNNGDLITLSTEGDHTLYLCAEDNAGNRASWNGVYRLDKTIPVVSATNASAVWSASPISVTMSESDPIPSAGTIVSQTSTKKYYWDYQNALGAATVTFAYCMANGTNYVNGFNMSMNTEGDHTLYLCANDVAGNNSTLWTGVYRYDATPPTAANLTYANAATNGWTNNTTITLNWVANDPMPGSGIKNHDVRIYESAGNAQDPIVWNLISTITTAGAAPTYTYVGTNGKAYKFEVLPRDNANNTPAPTWTTSADIARIDTTVPNQNNLNMVTAVNLLATGSQNFVYTFNDGGAPITLVGQMEDKSNPGGWVASFASPPHAYVQSIYHDVSIVDAGGDRTTDANSARTYTHNITQICDQAGNCWNGSKTYSYIVYANPNFNFTIFGNNTTFTASPVVADGNAITWQAQIQDGFGNVIIPALGINRVVNYNLSNISNSMYLNQYTRSGPTSVYLVPPTGPEVGLTNAATQNLGAQISTTGFYPLGVKVYTPTSNGHTAPDQVSDPNASFSFDINLTVSDTLIGPSKNVTHASPTFRFEPLYRTVIQGEIKDGGFIEGTEQASTIDIVQNPIAVPAVVSGDQLEFTFSGSEATKFDFYANSTSPVSTIITNRTALSVSPSFNGGSVANYPLYTQLVQKPSQIVTNLSNLWLVTHLVYTLNGKNVVTNSIGIGKDSYFGAATPNLGSQVGVRILGAVSSKYINNMIDGQFQTGTVLLNYQSRSEIRNNVKKNIALAIRNGTQTAIGTVVTNLASLPVGAGATGIRVDQGGNGSIMYIEKTGGDIVLSTGAVSGIKTLVVKGANLWIMRDMYYTDTQSVLGVVVQKDESGNGGNLYISPSVTNVVGGYIVDGSIISYNGSELGYNTAASILKNQLLIYGSIVSENTIGGSRAATPICPSLVGVGACTLEIAQTYDLNYLRRYYLVGNNPSGGANVIGHGVCAAGFCGSFDPKLRKLFTNTNHELSRFPIVIEYNPLIQRTPPIGFGNVLSE